MLKKVLSMALALAFVLSVVFVPTVVSAETALFRSDDFEDATASLANWDGLNAGDIVEDGANHKLQLTTANQTISLNSEKLGDNCLPSAVSFDCYNSQTANASSTQGLEIDFLSGGDASARVVLQLYSNSTNNSIVVPDANTNFTITTTALDNTYKDMGSYFWASYNHLGSNALLNANFYYDWTRWESDNIVTVTCGFGGYDTGKGTSFSMSCEYTGNSKPSSFGFALKHLSETSVIDNVRFVSNNTFAQDSAAYGPSLGTTDDFENANYTSAFWNGGAVVNLGEYDTGKTGVVAKNATGLFTLSENVLPKNDSLVKLQLDVNSDARTSGNTQATRVMPLTDGVNTFYIEVTRYGTNGLGLKYKATGDKATTSGLYVDSSSGNRNQDYWYMSATNNGSETAIKKLTFDYDWSKWDSDNQITVTAHFDVYGLTDAEISELYGKRTATFVLKWGGDNKPDYFTAGIQNITGNAMYDNVAVTSVLGDAKAYKAKYATILAKTVDTVEEADRETITAALTEYSELSSQVQAGLTAEFGKLNALLAKLNEAILSTFKGIDTFENAALTGAVWTNNLVDLIKTADSNSYAEIAGNTNLFTPVDSVFESGDLLTKVEADVNCDGVQATLTAGLRIVLLTDGTNEFAINLGRQSKEGGGWSAYYKATGSSDSGLYVSSYSGTYLNYGDVWIGCDWGDSKSTGAIMKHVVATYDWTNWASDNQVTVSLQIQDSEGNLLGYTHGTSSPSFTLTYVGDNKPETFKFGFQGAGGTGYVDNVEYSTVMPVVNAYKEKYATLFDLDVEDITEADREAIFNASTEYAAFDGVVKSFLTNENAKLTDFNEKLDEAIIKTFNGTDTFNNKYLTGALWTNGLGGYLTGSTDKQVELSGATDKFLLKDTKSNTIPYEYRIDVTNDVQATLSTSSKLILLDDGESSFGIIIGRYKSQDAISTYFAADGNFTVQSASGAYQAKNGWWHCHTGDNTGTGVAMKTLAAKYDWSRWEDEGIVVIDATITLADGSVVAITNGSDTATFTLQYTGTKPESFNVGFKNLSGNAKIDNFTVLRNIELEKQADSFRTKYEDLLASKYVDLDAGLKADADDALAEYNMLSATMRETLAKEYAKIITVIECYEKSGKLNYNKNNVQEVTEAYGTYKALCASTKKFIGKNYPAQLSKDMENLSEKYPTGITNRKIRIETVGHSMVQGAGRYGANSQFWTNGAYVSTDYPKVLGQLLGDGFEIYNCGWGGGDTRSQLHANMLAYEKEIEPDVIILTALGNDAYHGLKEDVIEANFRQLIAYYQSLECAPTLVVTSEPYWIMTASHQSRDVSRMNAIEKRVAEELGLLYIDIDSYLKAKFDADVIALGSEDVAYDKWYSDGTHYTDYSYPIMAEAVYSGLKNLVVTDTVPFKDYKNVVVYDYTTADKNAADAFASFVNGNDMSNATEAYNALSENALNYVKQYKASELATYNRKVNLSLDTGNKADAFASKYATLLGKSSATAADYEDYEAAMTEYFSLPKYARQLLATEKAKLDTLGKEICSKLAEGYVTNGKLDEITAYNFDAFTKAYAIINSKNYNTAKSLRTLRDSIKTKINAFSSANGIENNLVRIAYLDCSAGFRGLPGVGAPVSTPNEMQKALGDGYIVKNFGQSGVYVLKTGNKIIDTEIPAKIAETNPNIVVINMGMTDWVEGWINGTNCGEDGAVETALTELVNYFKTLDSAPTVVLCTMSNVSMCDRNNDAVYKAFNEVVVRTASKTGAVLADLATATKDWEVGTESGVSPIYDQPRTVHSVRYGENAYSEFATAIDAVIAQGNAFANGGILNAFEFDDIIDANAPVSKFEQAYGEVLESATPAEEDVLSMCTAINKGEYELTAEEEAKVEEAITKAGIRPVSNGATLSTGAATKIGFACNKPDNSKNYTKFGVVISSYNSMVDNGITELTIGAKDSLSFTKEYNPNDEKGDELIFTIGGLYEQKENWNKWIVARFFCVYEDANGNEITVYNDNASPNNPDGATEVDGTKGVIRSTNGIIKGISGILYSLKDNTTYNTIVGAGFIDENDTVVDTYKGIELANLYSTVTHKNGALQTAQDTLYMLKAYNDVFKAVTGK